MEILQARILEWAHPIKPHISLVATSCEGRVGEDGISLTAELGIDLDLISTATYHRLSRIDAVGEAQVHDSQGRILVYYPDRDDTLFSVARRFHTTPKKVAIDNALTESALADRGDSSSLHGVERLIIK